MNRQRTGHHMFQKQKRYMRVTPLRLWIYSWLEQEPFLLSIFLPKLVNRSLLRLQKIKNHLLQQWIKALTRLTQNHYLHLLRHAGSFKYFLYFFTL